jgi:hypothetical protein
MVGRCARIDGDPVKERRHKTMGMKRPFKILLSLCKKGHLPTPIWEEFYNFWLPRYNPPKSGVLTTD